MIDLNRELLLDELSNFEKRKTGEIPDLLNKYLESVAQNGDTMFSWNKLQPLLRRKLEVVMNEFNQLCPTDHLMPLPNVKPFDFEELKAQILEAIDSFCSAPFTIQRICELITCPSKHYKRTDKFMRGIEKNILVVTTIEPKSANGSDLSLPISLHIPFHTYPVILPNSSNTLYSTSSFKTLFSALHSTSNSCHSTASTSLLVNGIADVLCDNQMPIRCSNDLTQNTISSPVSPTSLPLSPTTNSPPNQHLPPLQQLDSFTTVFASSSPSTPLSVVSDLHSYEHSSSLALMSSLTAGDSPSSSTSTATISMKAPESDLESCPHNPGLDSTLISPTSIASQANTSTDIESEIKTDFTQNDSNTPSKQTLESNESTVTSELSEDLSQTETNDNNKDLIENNNRKEEMALIDTKAVDSSDNSVENQINTNIETNENLNICVKTDNTSEETINCENQLNEENKPLIQVLTTESQSEPTLQNLENNNEMRTSPELDSSQPMDYCGSNANNENNTTDITEFNVKNSESTPDCNVMDDTLSQSDQSEPMDED